MLNSRTRLRAFTLVELMIVVAIVGVLAGLAIYGVRKYVNSAKTAEARNAVGQMAKDASAAYDREGMEGDVVGMGDTAAKSNRLCPSAAAPVPSDPAKIQGMKYQSAPGDWNDDAGWSCLRFQVKDPQYFQYNYVATPPTGGANAGDSFECIARGDLNGDGVLSSFKLAGAIQAASGGGMELTLAPAMVVTNPED
jgi:type IV pilus assembly protein PilA